ncbi:AtpZ/AtpI family protein [Anaerofustis stercorihominis]|nr:AtpZ/AtpI family protein [Anaerofustis stercorihominis]
MTQRDKNNEMSDIAKAVSIILQLGLTMVVTILLCLFFGKFLDSKFHKDNLWTLIFLFLGVCAALRNMYYIIKSFINDK